MKVPTFWATELGDGVQMWLNLEQISHVESPVDGLSFRIHFVGGRSKQCFYATASETLAELTDLLSRLKVLRFV